jgi:hypothetical protein
MADVKRGITGNLTTSARGVTTFGFDSMISEMISFVNCRFLAGDLETDVETGFPNNDDDDDDDDDYDIFVLGVIELCDPLDRTGVFKENEIEDANGSIGGGDDNEIGEAALR